MNNPFVVAIMALLFLIILVFLVFRNKFDRRKLEDKLNKDYRKPRHQHDNTDQDSRSEKL